MAATLTFNAVVGHVVSLLGGLQKKIVKFHERMNDEKRSHERAGQYGNEKDAGNTNNFFNTIPDIFLRGSA